MGHYQLAWQAAPSETPMMLVPMAVMLPSSQQPVWQAAHSDISLDGHPDCRHAAIALWLLSNYFGKQQPLTYSGHLIGHVRHDNGRLKRMSNLSRVRIYIRVSMYLDPLAAADDDALN